MVHPSVLHGLWPSTRRGRRLLTAAAIVFGALGIWLWRDLVNDLPDRGAISKIGTTAQSTMVFDGSDRQVSTIFRQQRIDVPLSNIARDFIRALVSIEDQRFYLHG